MINNDQNDPLEAWLRFDGDQITFKQGIVRFTLGREHYQRVLDAIAESQRLYESYPSDAARPTNGGVMKVRVGVLQDLVDYASGEGEQSVEYGTNLIEKVRALIGEQR